ncbi:hypothetical protein J1605_019542 [Eschrichtius robustus]|uniref:Mitotic spindle assembly checkpoint protein MAD1 n=1 Tax=Eschrichtius robustus TaxID=9764 RepID=A0AB34HIM3_ESCRO|nr:hypothetical protein J1605_019542 [Eschrichtius robustus]
MEDLGENTTVLSTLRSLNNFISQRVEGGSGLDVSTSAPGSLQMQYQQSMQLEERAEQIRSRSHLIQVEREKTQMELSHKRARVELERAASASARSYEREVDRNQELLTRVRQLQEREAEAEEKVKAQLERYRSCQQSLDAASKELREKEGGLAEAGETISVLKGRLSDLQWSVMNQEMQVKRLESEKQELKEQLELQHRKWQDANQQVQELQASQDARVDHAQRVKDLEQKLALQEQDAAVVKNMRSELVRLPTMERELRQLREENACLREMRDTNGLLREELEGLQRRLGRQEKMQETLVDLELEKERLLTKLQSWERLDQTTGLSISVAPPLALSPQVPPPPPPGPPADGLCPAAPVLGSEALTRLVAPAAGVFERLSRGSRAGASPAAVSGQNGARVSALDTKEGRLGWALTSGNSCPAYAGACVEWRSVGHRLAV